MKPLLTLFIVILAIQGATAQQTAVRDTLSKSAQKWKAAGRFDVHVFPNPTPGPLIVQIDPLNALVGLRLFDAENRAVLIIDEYKRLGTAPLDLKSLPPGEYRLEVRWNGLVRNVPVARAADLRPGNPAPLIGSSAP